MTGLTASDLSFSYGGTPILQGWSAEFPAGSTTAMTGRSGHGKSTALYLLGLMLQPAAGEVILDGVPVSGLPDAAKARLRAHHYGFVFQDAALDPTRTVIDNVRETALYRGLHRKAVTTRAHELLDRFDVVVPPHRRPGQISGGQAQRVALCRALLSEPPILLADEPTGNLDAASSRVVMDALRDHAATGATVVVVTHSLEVADACDRRLAL